MKTKEEILKMNADELQVYKWSDDLNLLNTNLNCSNCLSCLKCSNCLYCSDCINCSYCYRCRNISDGKNHKYMICNVQLTKEEYEKKMEKLK